MRDVRVLRLPGTAALLVALAFVNVDAQSAPEAAPLAPLDVVARAVARWQARPRPARLSYTVDLDGTRKGGTYTRRFRVDYVAQNRNAQVTELASEGAPPPFVEPEKQRIFPDDTFGFVPRDKAPGGDARTAPRETYDVKLLPNDSVDGRRAYHLQFVPKTDPDVNVLREVWIDAQTYDVTRIGARETEHIGMLTVPYVLTAWYAQEGPYWLVRRIEGSGSMHTPLFSYSSSAEATFLDLHYEP